MKRQRNSDVQAGGYQLVRIDTDNTKQTIPLPEHTQITVGRFQLGDDARISRKSAHITFGSNRLMIRNVGRSKLTIKQSPAATPYRAVTLETDEELQLHVDDIVCFLPDHYHFKVGKPPKMDSDVISSKAKALRASPFNFNNKTVLVMPHPSLASGLQLTIWTDRLQARGARCFTVPPWTKQKYKLSNSFEEEIILQREATSIIQQATSTRDLIIIVHPDDSISKVATWLGLPTLPLASNVPLLSKQRLASLKPPSTTEKAPSNTTLDEVCLVEYKTYVWLTHQLALGRSSTAAASPPPASNVSWRPWQSPWGWDEDSDIESEHSIRATSEAEDREEAEGHNPPTAAERSEEQQPCQTVELVKRIPSISVRAVGEEPSASPTDAKPSYDLIGTGRAGDPTAINPLSTTIPSTHPDMSQDALKRLVAWGDESSRWGLPDGAQPIRCPFTRKEILAANSTLIKLNPWLDVIVDQPTEQKEANPAQTNAYGQATGENRNEHITKWLKMLFDVYQAIGGADNEIRCKQLEHAIGYLMHSPERVVDVSQLHGLPGFGASTIAKITEILQTGKLQRAEALYNDPRNQSLMLFKQILWVGPVTARKWYDLGLRTLQDVKTTGASMLTLQQKIGLKYFDELQHRIPREESNTLFRIVKQEVDKLMPGSLCVLGGSYRRGQPTSSDFDFILAPQAPKGSCALLIPLYERLKAMGILTDDLLASWMSVDGTPVKPDTSERSCHTYFGICVVPGIPGALHRRIDLKCFSHKEAPYALISWTGNTPLNRTIRQFATNLGYELDELSMLPTAFKKAEKRSGRHGMEHAGDVGCRCEFDVFSFLGLRFIPPNQRNPFSHHFDFNKAAT